MDEIGSDIIIIQPNEVVKEQESIHKSESLGVVVAAEEGGLDTAGGGGGGRGDPDGRGGGPRFRSLPRGSVHHRHCGCPDHMRGGDRRGRVRRS